MRFGRFILAVCIFCTIYSEAAIFTPLSCIAHSTQGSTEFSLPSGTNRCYGNYCYKTTAYSNNGSLTSRGCAARCTEGDLQPTDGGPRVSTFCCYWTDLCNSAMPSMPKLVATAMTSWLAFVARDIV